jgi:AraC-like DNA-binding protein
VLPFALPSTTSLRSAFGLDASQACEVLGGGGGCGASTPAAWTAPYLFARAALANRLTLSDPTPTGERPPAGGAEARLFRRYALPLIEGRARSSVGGPAARLRGARLTSIAALGASYAGGGEPTRYGCAAPDSRCLYRWRRLAVRHRFADRLFVYLCDEPWVDPARRWPVCKKAARGVETGPWPAARKLVTTWIQDARAHHAARLIDTITAPIEEIADKPGFARAGNQRPAYASFLRRPRRALWLYTFCDQYGCRPSRSPGRYWSGWPGYAIDQPPSQARAMGWLAFDYGAGGELYYSVDGAFASAWSDTYSFGGNGGGTLFYPGLPGGEPATGAPAIGGRDPIPLESMRLKRLRDGREDYEYLRLAAKRGHRRQAMAVVRGLLGSRDVAAFSATFGQGAVGAARCRLARLIAPGVGGCH